MRPRRSCSIVSRQKVSDYFNPLKDNSNLVSSTPLKNNKRSSKKRFSMSDSSESDISSKWSIKENYKPPKPKIQRTNSFRPSKIDAPLKDLNNQISKPVPAKVSKLSRSNTCVTSKTHSKLIKSPVKKITKMKKVKENSFDKPPPSSRYILRSNSFKTRPTNNDHLFLTPQAPIKPLKSLARRSIHEKTTDSNMSQISECSFASSSGLSSSILSRFVKKKSKTSNKEVEKARKWIRIIESSMSNADSSSCTSICDDNQSFSILPQDPEQKILLLCGQDNVKTWPCYFEEQTSVPIGKIGEGVYGEVFRLSEGNVLKVFPVGGDMLANAEEQMAMDDVFSEVFVSRKLTDLNSKVRHFQAPNFVQLKKASLLRGKLPMILVHEWKRFEREKGTDNECLSFLPEKQKWMALEYGFAGEPLSDYKFNCYAKVRGIVEQICLSLAVAEAALQFEHRDLHWKNVLVRPTDKQSLNYRIGDRSYVGGCHGIFVTVIDFTVARMCVDGNTVYMDMADCPEIFEGEGDYQFEVYRMMRADNRNQWRDFNPRSNLYWVHYLVDKLLNETSYPRGDPDARGGEADLRRLHGRLLGYRDVGHLVLEDPYFEGCLVVPPSSSSNHHHHPVSMAPATARHR